MMQFRIQHVSVIVSDLAKSLRFYTQVLNLAIDPARPELGYTGAWLILNSQQQIHLLCLDNPDPVRGRPEHGGRDRHTALLVEDLSSLQRNLEDAKIPYTLSRSGRLALFCRDPDGNALEFIQNAD